MLFNKVDLKFQKIYRPIWQDLYEALLKWFTVQRTAYTPINGHLLIAKTEELARLLKDGKLMKKDEDFLFFLVVGLLILKHKTILYF